MSRKLVVGIFVGTVVTGLIVLGALLVPRWFADVPTQSRRLESLLEEGSKVGLPRNERDVWTATPVTDDVVKEAMPIIWRIAQRNIRTSSLDRGPSDEDYASSLSGYQQSVKDLRSLASALRKSSFRLPERQLTAIDPIENLTATGRTSWVVFYHAKRLVSARDATGALDFLRLLRRLGKAASTDPSFLGLIMSYSMDSRAMLLAERMLTTWASNPTVIRELREVLESTDYQIDLKHALMGEFLMWFDLIRNLDLHGGVSGVISGVAPNEGDIAASYRTSGLPKIERDRAFAARHVEAYINFSQMIGRDPEATPDWGEDFDRHMAQLAQRGEPSFELMRAYFNATNDDVGSYYKTASFVVSRRIRYQMMISLIKLIQKPNENPDLPSDPFRPGSKVNISRQDGVVKIWSVGQDKVDHKGVLRRTASGGSDVVVVLPSTVRPRAGSS